MGLEFCSYCLAARSRSASCATAAACTFTASVPRAQRTLLAVSSTAF